MNSHKLFMDSFGDQHVLDPAWRNNLHPDWQSMLNPQKITPKNQNDGVVAMNYWIQKNYSIENFLGLHGLTFKDKKILEIGAYDGATAFALAQIFARQVIGSDLSYYYVNQDQNKSVDDNELRNIDLELDLARKAYSNIVSKEKYSIVSFINDDICKSTIESNAIDCVVSFEVLEHLVRPQDAFIEIERILKPGGYAFHEYNPFFSIGGGHSLASAEFPWGHARLDSTDFEKMILESRYSEKEASMRFYLNALNRMTLSNLKKYVEEAGLKLLALVPFPNYNHLQFVTSQVLDQSKRVYNDVELMDLISPYVWVLIQKPNSKSTYIYNRNI